MLLVYIHSLPYDIQRYIYELTVELRKPRKVLPERLQFQLKHHRGIFYNILSKLYDVQSELMHEKYRAYSFLVYKMVFVLNDYKYTENHYVNSTVRSLFHGLSDHEIYVYNHVDTYLIYDQQSMINVVKFMIKCWTIMNAKQRLQLNSL
jgi:hypothetical protein